MPQLTMCITEGVRSDLVCKARSYPRRARDPCESGGGRPGLPSLIIRTVSVDVKQHSTNDHSHLLRG